MSLLAPAFAPVHQPTASTPTATYRRSNMHVTRLYLLALVVVGLSASAVAVPLTIVNADFSAIPITCAGYSYQFFGGDCNSIPPQQDFNATPGFGWTLIIQS